MINLWLERRQTKKIFKEIVAHFPNETGGLLAGYIAKNNEKVVTRITVSGSRAQHYPNSYIPDYKFDEQQIAKIYKKSKRIEIYLGDWHSHPGGGSYLSQIDKNTLERIARYEKARIATPIMIIVGTMPFEIKAWQYLNGSLTELQLNLF